ncbi:hypothetical protein SteCoe_20859 [Stentor coeruleus]|uniref:Uncharacterized protein n=1 Tax=Stentor coeruleus TaxID=5963 RepID=A0A1R2BR23_9CILI|nr:hypothetical protein SteCoe_20859 [Stentor coeruleus]
MARIIMNSKDIIESEPILRGNSSRFVMFPKQYSDIWTMYKKHEASFWTAEKLDLSQDLQDWENLTDNEKYFIKNILAFFAASDRIVLENLATKFFCEVQIPEARAFYGFQIVIENIHSGAYSMLIDTYITDAQEKTMLLNDIIHLPSIKKKADWALKWVNNSDSFAQRLVAYAIIEGIFFSGSFCAIFWVKKRSLMPGLTSSNKLISRDKSFHTDFSCLLYSHLVNKLSQDQINELICEAIEIEKEFIIETLPVEIIGMNSRLMSQYLEFISDRLLIALGYDKLYRALNPFEWMEIIPIQYKTNFIENRVNECQKTGVMAKKDEQMFKIDMEF